MYRNFGYNVNLLLMTHNLNSTTVSVVIYTW